MIAREVKIEQSIMDYVRAALVEQGYTDELLTVREAFPGVGERSAPLSKTTLAIGFNFDDGGTQAELGSNLTRYLHTVEFWVFGTTVRLGRAVAYAVRDALKETGLVPLKDVGVAGQPVIDQIVLMEDRGVRVERQIATDPLAWDLNVYTATARFEDYAYPE